MNNATDQQKVKPKIAKSFTQIVLYIVWICVWSNAFNIHLWPIYFTFFSLYFVFIVSFFFFLISRWSELRFAYLLIVPLSFLTNACFFSSTCVIIFIFLLLLLFFSFCWSIFVANTRNFDTHFFPMVCLSHKKTLC